jgi:hypothetical protein
VVYVGNKHTATVTARTELMFRCVHCAAESSALVVGVGQGAGNSAFFLDESGAKERARDSAGSAAERNALLTLDLAACPACGKRNESALSALKGKAILGVVGTLIAFPIIGLIFDALKRGHIGLYIFIPTGLFTAWAIWNGQKWKWETVDDRVAFLERQDPVPRAASSAAPANAAGSA